jgi:hypothetical protein
MIVDMLLSDFDDDLKKNKLIDLNFSYNDQLLDDIELNRVVVVEYNHHVLHNIILDELIYYEDDQQNDLIVKIVFVEKFVLLLLMV